jgi:hypothetical protein
MAAFDSSYIKMFLAALLICGGVAGGIYLGDAAVRRKASHRISGSESLAPNLAMGDLFPLVNYQRRDGSTGTFEQFLMGKRSVVMFLSSKCGRCEDLLSLWNMKVAPVLDMAVQVVVCFRTFEIPPTISRLLGSKIVMIPEERLYQLLELRITPTLVGLDEYGLVVYLQPGYLDSFGSEFYERFAMRAE